MKTVWTLAFTLLFSVVAHAQLQITRADIESRIQAEQVTSYEATNAEGMTFDMSGPLYDMTAFETTSETFQTTYVDPSTTPYPHEFPAATHAQVYVTSEGSGYLYLRLDDDGLYMQGVGTEVQGTDFLLKYEPERPEMLFPFKLGSSWTYTSGVMSPFEGMEQVEESETEVVAEGTLRTPDGDYPCLVVKQWNRTSTKIEFGGQVISQEYMTDISYEFITRDGVSATLGIDTLDEGSGTPTLTYASWSVAAMQTSAQAAPVARDLDMSAPYPNPLRSGLVSVEWSSDVSGAARVEVIDIYGRVYRQLDAGSVSGSVQRSRLDVTGLPAGQYFLRVLQGTKVALRPLTVVH
ncbi:MAG: T9SS type A sorting domain-containing protein [Bacteroidota bacterium]|nr:T9SS type A sorting domain-containing protein [Bacteroidota bacterium]